MTGRRTTIGMFVGDAPSICSTARARRNVASDARTSRRRWTTTAAVSADEVFKEDEQRPRDRPELRRPLAAHDGARRRALCSMLLALCVLFASSAAAQGPPSMSAKGCCCVAAGAAWRCAEKTQADCLANEPAAPIFPKIGDWKKMFDDYVASSWEQARSPTHGGWIAESCGADVSPVTGEPRGAPVGCCCLPKLHPSGDDRFDCKPGTTHFDCKAECWSFKDGRRCTWTEGTCPK